VALALEKLINAELRGIVHMTSQGQCSWFEFAKVILETFGVSARVKGIRTEELERPARRPAYSVLENARVAEFLGADPMPEWHDGLERFSRRF
jgi:dTDP-4-dehydrorhamnose reductase